MNTPSSNRLLPRKLLMARKAVGLSTRAVAEKVSRVQPVSHGTIANYEKGRTLPTIGVLAALADVYGRPLQWFVESGPVLTSVRYRNLKSKVGVGDRHRFEGEAQRWLDAYCRLEDHLDRPLRAERGFEPDEDEAALPPAEAAAYVRKKKLGLADDQPLSSASELLEKAGIRAMEVPTALRIDGLAADFGDEHAVVLNPSLSSDRARMNALHEFRHVRAGHCSADSADAKGEERDAFEFASHMLLPEPMLKEAFKGRSFVRMVEFKERYGISLAAMVYRAQGTVISKEDARKLWIEFSRRGWRSDGAEPGRVRPDRPTRFEQMLEVAINEGELTWREASRVTGLRDDELRGRLDQATRTLPPRDRHSRKGGATDQSGLRLVR